MPSGQPVTSFRMATNRKWTDRDGNKQEQTEWHSIVCFGRQAEIAGQYLTKGKQVAVEGKLTHRSYETKEGEKRYITEVKCNELLMLGK